MKQFKSLHQPHTAEHNLNNIGDYYDKINARKPTKSPIETISTAEFARPAKRPMYSAFDCSKLSRLLGRKPISWQEGLKRHLQEVGAFKGQKV